jgi:hypothetical protein
MVDTRLLLLLLLDGPAMSLLPVSGSTIRRNYVTALFTLLPRA